MYGGLVGTFLTGLVTPRIEGPSETIPCPLLSHKSNVELVLKVIGETPLEIPRCPGLSPGSAARNTGANTKLSTTTDIMQSGTLRGLILTPPVGGTGGPIEVRRPGSVESAGARCSPAGSGKHTG